MRVTNHMLTTQVQRNISRSLSALQRLQLQMASGKAILEASDDPVGSSLAVNLRAAVAAREQYQKNGESAEARLTAAETTLDGLQTLLQEVRGTAVQGANETGGREQRRILSDQVNQSLEGLYDLALSRFGAEYVFGGNETGTAPYQVARGGSRPTTLTGRNEVSGAATALDAAGLPDPITDGSFSVTRYDAAGAVAASGSVSVTAGVTTAADLATALSGLGLTASVGADGRLTVAAPAGGSLTLGSDTSGVLDALGLTGFRAGEIQSVTANPRGISGQRYQEILEGVTLPVNVTGPEVFTESVDLFQTLLDLRDALRANDTAGISAGLSAIDAGIDQASAALGSVGGRIQRLKSSQETLAADLTRVKGLLSRIENADVAETLLAYQQEQQLYESALNAGARIIQPSLLDFLR